MIVVIAILLIAIGSGICGVAGEMSPPSRRTLVIVALVIAGTAAATVLTSETILREFAERHGGMKGLLVRPTPDGGESTPWAPQIERTSFLYPAATGASVILLAAVAGTHAIRKRGDGALPIWACAAWNVVILLGFAVVRHVSTWNIFI